MAAADITFVLVRTRFASNLGSAVRAMANMGFSRLILVQPACEVGMEARSHAMRGAPILDRAVFEPSLETVRDGLGTLAGTTGSPGSGSTSVNPLRRFSEELLERVSPGPLGLVFGPEDNGLSRPELNLCQWLVTIPTAPDCPSLNLAHAVALVAYEVRLASARTPGRRPLRPAGPAEISRLLQQTQRLLETVPGLPADPVLKRIRRLVSRAALETEDVNMLLGLLKHLEGKGG